MSKPYWRSNRFILKCHNARRDPSAATPLLCASFRFVKKDSLALSAVVELAYGVVTNSFSKYGKLVIQSSMPDQEGILYTSTAGSSLTEQFQTIGLGGYLRVIPNELTDTEKALLDKYGQQLK